MTYYFVLSENRSVFFLLSENNACADYGNNRDSRACADYGFTTAGRSRRCCCGFCCCGFCRAFDSCHKACGKSGILIGYGDLLFSGLGEVVFDSIVVSLQDDLFAVGINIRNDKSLC